jgi:hypothetical protein
MLQKRKNNEEGKKVEKERETSRCTDYQYQGEEEWGWADGAGGGVKGREMRGIVINGAKQRTKHAPCTLWDKEPTPCQGETPLHYAPTVLLCPAVSGGRGDNATMTLKIK